MSNFQMIVDKAKIAQLPIPAKLNVVLVNGDSSKPRCGIYQHGLSVWDILSRINDDKSALKFHYLSVCDGSEFLEFDKNNQVDIYIFNGNGGTMPWLSLSYLRQIAALKIKYTHDITNYDAVFFSPGTFDFLLTDDLTVEITNPFVLKVGRLICASVDTIPGNNFYLKNKLKVGSFGLALPDKGFEGVVEKFVQQDIPVEFNFHMPKSDYMDPDGVIQKSIITQCKKQLVNSKNLLNISTEFLDKSDLVKFLANNDVNIFNYQANRGGNNQVSGITEYALAANRPFYVSRCPMFRNITNIAPLVFDFSNLNVDSDLTISFDKNLIAQEYIRSEWTNSAFVYDLTNALTYAMINKDMSRALFRNIKNYFKNKIRDKSLKNNFYDTNHLYTVNDSKYAIPQLVDFPDNSILDHEKSGVTFASIIDDIKATCPVSVANKVPVSLVQHAYVANRVMRTVSPQSISKIACLGAYGDILSEYLKKKGYIVFDIDPNINCAIEEYIERNPNLLGTFDICFSVSVLEHVPDDDGFVRGALGLLKPGGKFINTLDFRAPSIDDYLPSTHVRFYDEKALSNLVKLFGGEPNLTNNCWCDGINNFHYNNTSYTFATLFIEKLIK